MPIQEQSKNLYSINSSKNDELQSTPQMKLFDTEFERTEKQIIQLEKIFKSHLAIFASFIEESENK